MTARDRIIARLNPRQDVVRKHVQVHLSERQIASLETIAEAMSKFSGKRVSRNMLIEDAVEAFITEAQKETTL